MNVSPLGLLLSSVCLLLPSVVKAETLIPLTIESTPHTQHHEHPTQALEQSLASEWGLKSEEWQRYRRLMQGPLGVYSPNLDPLTALGIEARDPQEQQRYAEHQVQAEFVRVQKLLTYQNAYNDAYQRLYPGQLPVNLIGTESTPQVSPVSSSVRLAVFVSTHCKGCPERVRQLQQPASTTQTVSHVLHQLLIAARWGAHEGNDLFDRFSKNGLSPRWINVLQIRVVDPVAGPLLVCFEPVIVTES